MCCFWPPIKQVSATSIFARDTAVSRQLLVYGMTLEATSEVAMVLPLPVPPGSPDDAVRFIDLSGYPGFFADLRAGYPEPMRLGRGAVSGMAPAPALVVHDVGAFVASFVPTLAAFDRLAPRFRLPDQTWDALPGYRDHGFAVFQLKGFASGAAARPLHPMAFSFPRRDPTSLFFPTVHIHDGAVHPTATFDHTLYCQTDRLGPDDAAWRRSHQVASAFMRGNSLGIIEPDAHCFRRKLDGVLPNRDTVLMLGR